MVMNTLHSHPHVTIITKNFKPVSLRRAHKGCMYRVPGARHALSGGGIQSAKPFITPVPLSECYDGHDGESWVLCRQGLSK